MPARPVARGCCASGSRRRRGLDPWRAPPLRAAAGVDLLEAPQRARGLQLEVAPLGLAELLAFAIAQRGVDLVAARFEVGALELEVGVVAIARPPADAAATAGAPPARTLARSQAHGHEEADGEADRQHDQAWNERRPALAHEPTSERTLST